MTAATNTEINGQVTLKTLQAEGVVRKKPSEKLLNAINLLGKEAAGYFKKLEDRVNEVLELGRKEGFADLQIGDWIRAETKEHYSKMTIARLLPSTAKHMEKARFGNKMLPNSTQGRTTAIEGIENDDGTQDNVKIPTTYQMLDAEVIPKQLPPPKPLEQPGPEESQRSNSKPNYTDEIDRFDIDKLDTYPLEILRGVVRELYDKNTEAIGRIKHWASVNDELRRESDTIKKENAALKKENEQFKRLPNNDWLYNRIDQLKRENADLRKQLGQPTQQ
jgi:hypothetical protein